MALPKSYLTSTKNLSDILTAIVGAQAPEKFNRRFLESLDFTSSTDRLIIAVFKKLGLLAEDGTPHDAYHEYLDQTQSAAVLARGIRSAYADLFQVNRNAHKMTKAEVQNKFKTLSKGQFSDSVLDKMALTFTALCKHADFDADVPEDSADDQDDSPDETGAYRKSNDTGGNPPTKRGLTLDGLVYNIQLILPESRDPKVYDALFESLQRHLL